MASFKLGDRVSHLERPDECGTIVAVLDHGLGDVRYRIDWDSDPALVVESALVPCRASGLPRLDPGLG